jgi:hypothetical protein
MAWTRVIAVFVGERGGPFTSKSDQASEASASTAGFSFVSRRKYMSENCCW